jgi:hypothetical protein
MFDIFYSGTKPNLFAHEQPAQDIAHAQSLSRTRYFWWTNYLTDYTGFDFLFEPVPWERDQRHAWASQWQRDSGTYLIPTHGYTETNYRTDCCLTRLECRDNWTDIQDNFDYSWHPDYREPALVYQFGTQWQKTGGPRYSVPGAVDIKYVDQPRRIRTGVDNNCWNDLNYQAFDYTWHPDATDPPLIYQFGTQWQKTGGPRYSVPGAIEIKYVRTPYYNKTDQDNNWVVPDNVDNSSFDYTWHPDATDPPYNYQFGTQHQRTGGPQYIIPGAVDIKYVDQIRIRTQRTAQHIYVIDHLDDNILATTTQIKDNSNNINISTVRYFDNYLDTLRRIARTADKDGQEFVWICSSVCDYLDFDFSWHPEQWQAGMLHVFASDNNKFGDTFFMHVPTFVYRANQIELLDWYDVNYVGVTVPRRALPVVRHNYNTQVEAVKTTTWAGPLAVFTNQDNIIIQDIPAVSLWREKTKTVVPLSAGAGTAIVPRAAVPYIKKQLYDYPYIDRTQRHMYTDNLLDIVFIDNGEPNADDNYLYLKWAAERANNIKIHRSSGVDGRVAAYRAAAELSTTPWFFAVFAKLEVSSAFDWAWQPDRLQDPKHYIFHAYNPVNGLEYGHQAMIAYNKQLVLENTAPGLDFTLDQAHEVVPVVSGIANYHYSKWVAWRTAFRECIKLRHSLPDVENEYRLTRWLTPVNNVENSEYSIWGAEDAVEYYDSVAGDFVELRKSYDWAWLASYALIKRNLIPSQ